MQFTIIVPPNIETSITGFIMGAEKTIRNTQWRVEYHAGETLPRILKNGAPIDHTENTLPKSAVLFANAATQWFNKAQARRDQ